MATRKVSIGTGESSEEGLSSSETRASSTRASSTRNYAEKARLAAKRQKAKMLLMSNILDFPESVRERMRLKGYDLRWLRFKESANGQDDLANINKWQELGFVPLLASEAPELTTGFHKISHGVYGDLIIRKDLAAFKILIEDRDIIRETKEEKTKMVSQGIFGKLKGTGLKTAQDTKISFGGPKPTLEELENPEEE